MADRNAYAILGLQKGASEQEIKKAFVNLVKKYDPEVHTERYMTIQDAYNKLKDPKKRAQVDVLTFNVISGQYLFNDNEKNDNAGDAEDKIQALRQKLSESGGDQKVKNELIEKLMQQSFMNTRKQLWAEAIKNWEEVQSLDPSNVRARNNLMFAYVTLGLSYALHSLYDESIELWEKALALNPDNGELVHNLALAAEEVEDEERSNKYWNEITERWKKELNKAGDDEYLREVLVEAHRHNSAVAEKKNGGVDVRKSQQMRHYREVLELKPDDFDAQYRIANSLLEEKRFPEAVKEFEEIHRKHPKNIEVINTLGWAYVHAGQVDKGFLIWQRGLGIDPDNSQTKENIVRAHLALGKQYRTKGMFTPALVHLKKLLRFSKSPEVFMEIGATYDMKGDKRSAQQAYEQVLKIDAKHQQARKALQDLRMR